ncbi:hypothetical protein FQR65_LT18614 [Abscondita terminalis]|nr:hypothetical protein FQR65_LT18614 [Abscondita terminalis]
MNSKFYKFSNPELSDDDDNADINSKPQSNMSKQKGNNWSNYAARIIISTASHPLEYAKVLIQIGYEPIAPIPTTTLFGKPALKLPNIFEYVKYIKSVDGFSGCYRGLFPKVCGNLASAIATQKVIEHIERDKEENEEDLSEMEDDKK